MMGLAFIQPPACVNWVPTRPLSVSSGRRWNRGAHPTSRRALETRAPLRPDLLPIIRRWASPRSLQRPPPHLRRAPAGTLVVVSQADEGVLRGKVVEVMETAKGAGLGQLAIGGDEVAVTSLRLSPSVRRRE